MSHALYNILSLMKDISLEIVVVMLTNLSADPNVDYIHKLNSLDCNLEAKYGGFRLRFIKMKN